MPLDRFSMVWQRKTPQSKPFSCCGASYDREIRFQQFEPPEEGVDICAYMVKVVNPAVKVEGSLLLVPMLFIYVCS